MVDIRAELANPVVIAVMMSTIETLKSFNVRRFVIITLFINPA